MFHVGEQHRLRQLEDEAVGRASGVLEQGAGVGDEVRRVDLRRADVERQAQFAEAGVARPPRELDAGLFQQQAPERRHEAAAFHSRDEQVPRHQAALGMAPARERLDAGDPALAVALCLVVQFELIQGQGCAQVRLKLQPFGDGALHHRVEEADLVLALAFRFVHRQVGAAHQRLDGLRAVAEHRDADARRAHVALVADRIGLAHLRAQRLGEVFRRGRGGDLVRRQLFDQDHELVATEAGDGVRFAHRGAQPRRRQGQQLVAGLVAEQVVDVLEVVEVDEDQRAVPAVAVGMRERLVQAIGQQAPVGERGQVIVEGEGVDFRLAFLGPRDVGEAADIMGDDAMVVTDRADGQALRIHLAVAAPFPDLALPQILVLHLRPQVAIEDRAVAVRVQDAGWPADHLAGGVAGDLGEGLVDAQDAGVGIGDHHALLRLEGDRRDAPLLLQGGAMGDVLHDRDHGARRLFALDGLDAALEDAVAFRCVERVFDGHRPARADGIADCAQQLGRDRLR